MKYPFFLLLAFSAGTVLAQGFPNPLGQIESFPQLIGTITGNLIIIATVLSVAAIVITGFRFIAAAVSGNPQELTSARKTFWWILIGTAVVVGAYALAQAVVNFIRSPQAPITYSPTVAPPQPQPAPVPEPTHKPEPTSPPPSPESKPEDTITIKDEIFDDGRIDVNTPQETATVVNESENKEEKFDITKEGAGIELVRASYPNVFVMGGDLPINEAIKLKEALDNIYNRLPQKYRDRIILVPVEHTLGEDLYGVLSPNTPYGVYKSYGFVSANNVIVLTDIANGERDGKPSFHEYLPVIIAHELGHTAVEAECDKKSCETKDPKLRELYQKANNVGGFPTTCAAKNSAEFLAEMIAAATVPSDTYFPRKQDFVSRHEGNTIVKRSVYVGGPYTGNQSADDVLEETYHYLKEKGYILEVPKR